MGKLFYSVLLFGVALQMAAYLANVTQWFPNQMLNGNLVGMETAFSLTPFVNAFSIVGAVGGAAAIGLASLLVRPGTYAIYAMVLWAIAMFIPVVQNFFLAIPNFIASLQLPANVIQIVTYGVATPIVTFAAFWFLFMLVSGRYD